MEKKEISNITTIKLSKSTKDRLDYLKEYKRETYDEVLQKMLEILNISRVSPERARARLISVERKKRRQNKSSRIKKSDYKVIVS